MLKVTTLLIALFFVLRVFALPLNDSSQSLSQKKQIALIYKGPGSCPEDCSESAAEIARLAGLTPQFMSPTDDNPELFKNAAIWIQPGGKSSVVGKNMTPRMKDLIRQFVSEGGAYVGFCAGGFYATDLIGSTGNQGLGLIHAESSLYHEVNHDVEILSLNWNGTPRSIYWEGGPYFTLPQTAPLSALQQPISILATYPNGTAATITAQYGLGKVVVTGAHPEAPAWWSTSENVQDNDGVDHDLALDMVNKALK